MAQLCWKYLGDVSGSQDLPFFGRGLQQSHHRECLDTIRVPPPPTRPTPYNDHLEHPGGK